MSVPGHQWLVSLDEVSGKVGMFTDDTELTCRGLGVAVVVNNATAPIVYTECIFFGNCWTKMSQELDLAKGIGASCRFYEPSLMYANFLS